MVIGAHRATVQFSAPLYGVAAWHFRLRALPRRRGKQPELQLRETASTDEHVQPGWFEGTQAGVAGGIATVNPDGAIPSFCIR